MVAGGRTIWSRPYEPETVSRSRCSALLHTASDRISGGKVTYLAETDRRPSASLADWPTDPLERSPAPADLGAAGRSGGDLELGRAAVRRSRPDPDRSGRADADLEPLDLWRIPTDQGLIWLKAVPDFFAHEGGAVINWIGAPVAPRLIDFARGRALLADVAGGAHHDVQESAALQPMVRLLTLLQQRALDRLHDLAALGVPDRRLGTMLPGSARWWSSGVARWSRPSADHWTRWWRACRRG